MIIYGVNIATPPPPPLQLLRMINLEFFKNWIDAT